MANLMEIVQYIVLHPSFSTKGFLIKLFKNFEEQVQGFLNLTGVKLTAIQLKSSIAIKLKHFNNLSVGVTSLSLTLLLLCDTNSL